MWEAQEDRIHVTAGELAKGIYATFGELLRGWNFMDLSDRWTVAWVS
jgi:hypothetical protein